MSDPNARPAFDERRDLARVTVTFDRSLIPADGDSPEHWQVGAILRSGFRSRELSEPLSAVHAYAADVEAAIICLKVVNVTAGGRPCAIQIVTPSAYLVQVMTEQGTPEGNAQLWTDLQFQMLGHAVEWRGVDVTRGHSDASRAFALSCGAPIFVNEDRFRPH